MKRFFNLSTIVLLFFTSSSFQSSKNIGNSEIEKMKTYKGKEVSFEDFDEFLKSQLNTLKIPAISIAIINDGEIVYNKSLGVTNTSTNKPVSEKSIFESASLSKPVFAFFVMRLSEKGIIDLDRPLHYYLPDQEMERDQRYKNVTARMVLSHKTGFPNWRWFDIPPKDVKVNRGEFFMINNPGSVFSYSGEGYQYLARVIAHLNFLNMYELSELFQKEVVQPLGMQHAYFVWDDYLYENKVSAHIKGEPQKLKWGTALPNQNSKVFSASGGLRTESKSYAQFLISIIKGKGLYPETYKEMLSAHTEIPKDNTNYKEDCITDWSLGFGIKPMQDDIIYRHGGSSSGAQSEFAFSINKKYGYVFFVNCEKGNEFNEKLEQFLEMDTN